MKIALGIVENPCTLGQYEAFPCRFRFGFPPSQTLFAGIRIPFQKRLGRQTKYDMQYAHLLLFGRYVVTKKTQAFFCVVSLLYALVALSAWLVVTRASALELPAEQSEKCIVEPESIYVLAVGCCVPWREETKFCEKNTREFVDALVTCGRIPTRNIRIILGKEATYNGFEEGMKWLGKMTSPRSTALIYYLGHGGLIPHMQGDKEVGHDDYFILWSEQKPKSQWYAINRHIWLRGDRFNQLLESVSAERKLVIVDSCHLGAVIDPPPGQGRRDKTGLLAASRREELAAHTPDKGNALFTYELLRAIDNGASDLATAFEMASVVVAAVSKEVMSARKAEIEATEKDETKKADALKGFGTGKQTPQLIDPHGIAKMIRFSK